MTTSKKKSEESPWYQEDLIPKRPFTTNNTINGLRDTFQKIFNSFTREDLPHETEIPVLVSNSRSLANVFIEFSGRLEKERAPLTGMALNKLLYIVYTLIIVDKGYRIIEEPPIVGEWDPIFTELSESLSYFGGLDIVHKIGVKTKHEEFKENLHKYPCLKIECSKLWKNSNAFKYVQREVCTKHFNNYEMKIIAGVWSYYLSVGQDSKKLTTLTGGYQFIFEWIKAEIGLGNTISDKMIKNIFTKNMLSNVLVITS